MENTSNSFWNICGDKDELHQALKIVKEELFVLGYPAIHKFPTTDSSNDGLVIDLINTTWNLTREVKKHRLQKKDTLQDQSYQMQRSEQSQKELAKLQGKVVMLEMQNKRLHNDLQNASSGKDEAVKDTSLAKDNIEQLKKNMDFNNRRYIINLRKKELELRSLQNKFENLCKTGTRDNVRKEDVDNPNKSNTNETNKQMELAENSHRKVVSRLEENLEELVGENINLQQHFEKLGRIIYNVHARISSIKRTYLDSEEVEMPDQEQLFQLSCNESMDSYFGSISQIIEDTFNALINKLSQQ